MAPSGESKNLFDALRANLHGTEFESQINAALQKHAQGQTIDASNEIQDIIAQANERNPEAFEGLVEGVGGRASVDSVQEAFRKSYVPDVFENPTNNTDPTTQSKPLNTFSNTDWLGAGTPSEKTSLQQELNSLQEKELLKEFYDALKLPDEKRREKLSELLDSLDAPSALLENQYKLVQKAARGASGEDLNSQIDEFDARQEKKQAQQKLRLKKTAPITPQQHDNNQKILTLLLNPAKRKDALTQLAGHIHERLQSAGIEGWALEYEIDQEENPTGLLAQMEFLEALRQSFYQMQYANESTAATEDNWHVPEGIHSFGEPQTEQAASSQQNGEGQNNSGSKNNSRLNTLRDKLNQARKRRNEAKKLKEAEQAAKTAAEVATKAPLLLNPVFWIIILLVVVVLGFIVLISVITANEGGSNQSSQPDQSLPAQQATNHPTPPDYPSDLQQAIYDTFGVQANGLYSYEYRWLWEKLWDVSNTHFTALIKPAHITIVDGYRYATTGCSGTVGNKHCTITLHHWNTDGQEGFDVVVTHEFSHAIDSANPNSLTHASELAGAVVLDALDSKSEAQVPGGWLTWYGYLACFYHPPTLGIQLGEDYAETIAYYLNPTAIMRTACRFGPPPYSKGAHPNHYRLAQEILGIY